MQYSYRTSQVPPGSGLRWQILPAGSDTSIADSEHLSSDNLQQQTMTFTVPDGVSLLRVLLTYQRTYGMPRISGSLMVQSVQIQ